MLRIKLLTGLALLTLVAPARISAKSRVDGAADPTPASAPIAPALLDDGFADLYRLDFQGARQKFLVYQQMEPADPLGKGGGGGQLSLPRIQREGRFYLGILSR